MTSSTTAVQQRSSVDDISRPASDSIKFQFWREAQVTIGERQGLFSKGHKKYCETKKMFCEISETFRDTLNMT